MLSSERLGYINQRIRAEGAVSTIELARTFRVSHETIRRDLIALETSGRLRRVYGRAVADVRQAGTEAPYVQRSTIATQAKQVIGELCADHVSQDRSIFIDVGTTAQQVARALSAKFKGTVVTNSLLVAAELAEASAIEVIMAPGRLRRGEWSLTGGSTLKFLAAMHFDTAFLSCGGVDARAGVTDFDFEDVEVKRTVASRAQNSFVVADSSKHAVVGRYEVGEWHDMQALVTESLPSAGLMAKLRSAGTQLVTP